MLSGEISSSKKHSPGKIASWKKLIIFGLFVPKKLFWSSTKNLICSLIEFVGCWLLLSDWSASVSSVQLWHLGCIGDPSSVNGAGMKEIRWMRMNETSNQSLKFCWNDEANNHDDDEDEIFKFSFLICRLRFCNCHSVQPGVLHSVVEP